MRCAKAWQSEWGTQTPDTGQTQFVFDLTKPLKFECGGGCAVSTAGDYLRFAQILLQGGKLDGKRVLGRKTVEYMLANQLPPGTVNLIGNADPKEQLVVVFMAQTRGPIRWHYRYVVNAIVNQAIVD